MSPSIFVVSRSQVASSGIEPANYYVATPGNGGSDSNPGTISQPFATIGKANSVVSAGQLIYVRGGTYSTSSTITLSASGSAGNKIRLWAYPGETPIIDASGTSGTSYGIDVTGAFWHLKLVELKNAGFHGLVVEGNNAIVEFCNIHHNVRANGAGGNLALFSTASNPLILNNDIHHAVSSGTGGDGVQVYGLNLGAVLRGNRVYLNHDDGIDLWDSAGALIEGNWCWYNGYDDSLVKTSGNGCGVKFDGDHFPGGGGYTVRNNLFWHNGEDGILGQDPNNGSTVYNNTSWDHGRAGKYNFNFWSTTANTIKNNLSHGGNGVNINGANTVQTNSWNNPPNITVVDGTFLSLDSSGALNARQADGSLPVLNFLHLDSSVASGNNAVDKGTDVGLPFNGSAPDLGAYEI